MNQPQNSTTLKKILIVTGTRPNFVKVTQFKKQAENFPFLRVEIVHTGQHFDENMSGVFFKQFKLTPDYFLDTPGGSPVTQLAEIMKRLESLVNEISPNLIMAVGDVNSTLAAAIVANKMKVPLAHLESGLRSNDRQMPEEINRILTDEVSQYFFITEKSGTDNLRRDGKNAKDLFFVGNTMIDTLVAFKDEIEASNILQEQNIDDQDFVLMTVHRPATVDAKSGLEELVKLTKWLSEKLLVVFPMHPRTKAKLCEYGLYDNFAAIQNLQLLEPLDYFAFQKLIAHCMFILTDSGGIQEEATFLRKPCLTLRPNTERPSTIEVGSNILIGDDWSQIPKHVETILSGKFKSGKVPPLWDGYATERVLKALSEVL